MADELDNLLEKAVARLRAEWQASQAWNTLETAQADLDALDARDVQPFRKELADNLLSKVLQEEMAADEEEFEYRLASSNEGENHQTLNRFMPLWSFEFWGQTYRLEADDEGCVLVVPIPPAGVEFLIVGEQKLQLCRRLNNAIVQNCGYAELFDFIDAAKFDGVRPRIELARGG